MRIDESDIRVRHVPLGADIPGATEPSEDDHPRSSPISRRGRVAGALVVLVGSLALLAGFVTLGDDSPPEDPRASFAAEIHLGDAAELVLAAASDASGWAVTWTPLPTSDATGAVGAIPTPVVPRAEFPTLDASQAWLASESCVGTVCRLALTPVEDRSAVVATIDALDYVWHTEDAARLAWIERSDGTTLIRTGSVDRQRGLVTDAIDVVVMDARMIQLWDDAGFILGGEGTSAIGADGIEGWATDGSLVDAASTAVTVQRPDGGWAVLDRTDGSPIIESSPSETTVLVHRTRADGPVSSSDAGGYRYTFSLAPLAGDDVAVVEAEVVRLPIEFGAGAEYRLLRNSIGDRFTFDCTCPSGGT